ncbi:DNA primase [Butyrivibrio sp. AC2005]|uniref:DNA primase n=1 Tax=Butyrivibrio sp. AC2005 TaxID=1280672 RepID=UPI000677B7A6|nr:DNA primase [Butyrivibrio sp. AC2005]
MHYSDELIEEVKYRNDIVDVIGQYVTLKRSGNNYFGLCPFHNERSGSFSVSPSKQMFYCFGCGEGGNVLSFIMKIEKISFLEAVKMLAERRGVVLPQQNESLKEKRIRHKRSKLLEMNKEAANYCACQLLSKNGEKGLSYLRKRGVSDEVISRFGIWYSNDLVKYLHLKGYSYDLMIEVGLAAHTERYGTYDKFWNRIMFPIYDVNSRVIGFCGRTIEKDKPIFLYSPESPVLDKRRSLYGLNIAKRSKEKYMILCEGFMDVITMHGYGFDMAVGTLGISFTMQQAYLLKKYTDTVIIAFDSDSAGISHTLKCIEVLKKAGMKCKVLDLHPYIDPDDFLRNAGKEVLQERINHAQNPFFFEIAQKEKNFNMGDPGSKTEFYRYISGKLCEFTEPIERGNYIEAVARKYSINHEWLKELVNQMSMYVE